MSQSPQDGTINIIIVDRHPLVREGLRNSFETDPALNVVAEAGDAVAALLAGKENPHSILMISAFLNGANIFDVVKQHQRTFQETRVVICYAPEDAPLLQEFIDAGVSAMIGQEAMSAEYIAAAKAAVAGGVYFSANIIRCLIFDRKNATSRSNAYDLTNREAEVLRLLANGLSNKEIANTLDLSVRTAEAHRLSIRRKTSANTLSDLVRIAKAVGLVSAAGGPAPPGPDGNGFASQAPGL
ncbi:MAG: response regulator transcription factor [Pseudomonadota bacterium]